MLKIRGTLQDGRPIVVIGLSRENMARLSAGKPAFFDLSELGLVGQVFIFAGETEITMRDQIVEECSKGSVTLSMDAPPSGKITRDS